MTMMIVLNWPRATPTMTETDQCKVKPNN
jgi:hypothetical protein